MNDALITTISRNVEVYFELARYGRMRDVHAKCCKSLWLAGHVHATIVSLGATPRKQPVLLRHGC